jgi:hypothetical protein
MEIMNIMRWQRAVRIIPVIDLKAMRFVNRLIVSPNDVTPTEDRLRSSTKK